MKLVSDVLGWVGAVLVLIAYGMVSAGRFNGSSRLYQWLNLAGSMCLIVNTAFYGAFPSTAVNVVWGSIAIYTLQRGKMRSEGIAKAL